MSNCLIFCYFDNGGQGINLCDALNKHTDHTARCVTMHQTYLDYKTDVCLSDGDSTMDGEFDFFIMSEHLPDMIKDTDILKSATPKNTIIRTGGSTVRKNITTLRCHPNYLSLQQRTSSRSTICRPVCTVLINSVLHFRQRKGRRVPMSLWR